MIERCSQYKIYELFEKDLNIPKYQRPYSWSDEQVINLIEDLIEAFENKKDKYLIGNMIFYYKNDEIELVDGQQRTTTLALILKILKIEVDFLLKKVSELSIKSIKQNYVLIQNRLENYSKKDDFLLFLNNKVIVTTINTTDLDEAFMLFDSQNTRGKPLARKDLLKVHHIRFVDTYKEQKLLAFKWEKITRKQDNYDEMDELLYFLAIIRKATRGNLKADNLVYIDVFKEFKSVGNYGKLNNYNQPPIFEDFSYNIKNEELSLVSKSFDLRGFFKIANGLEYLPFEVNQSIEGGERFFWFILKYYQLFKQLQNIEIFNILDTLTGRGNQFLRKIYKSAILFYVDKFGIDYIDEYSTRVLLLLFYYRFAKHSIRKDGVVKFEWNDKVRLDLFKEILLSYSSDYLLQNIDKYIDFNLSKIVTDDLKGVKKDFYNSFKKYHQNVIDISKGKLC